jgi:uncharacterized protein (DUF952 family)
MIIYHLVPTRYFNRQDPRVDFYPRAFVQDGFIHCTRDQSEMARVANRFYGNERGPHLYLYIDTRKVQARIKYEDKGRKYPHIYGGLNRGAIVAVRPAPRNDAGKFFAPEPISRVRRG